MNNTIQKMASNVAIGGGPQQQRAVKQIVRAIETYEGAGFLVHRPFPVRKMDQFDPFLLLDHLGPVKYGPGEAKGAPWHPHRGFETITYMLQGEGQHRDSMGNTGFLRAGDIQWMTAGSGIIHDEGPSKGMLEKGGVMEGFQIWVNLPREKKMIPPYYQDINKEKIPTVTIGNTTIKVIAGESYGQKAVVSTTTPIIYLDVHTKEGEDFTLDIPRDMNAMCYVYRGQALFGSNEKQGQMYDMVELDHDGDQVRIRPLKNTQFLVLAGNPLNEPLARRGPFVMNTQEELLQAFVDYQEGKFVKQKAEMKSTTFHEEEFDPNNATIVT